MAGGAEYGDLKKFNKRLKSYSERVPQDVSMAVEKSSEELLANIQNRLSGGRMDGAPGLRTGEYRASWKYNAATHTVYTEHPASYRLEYGFVGVDSLGRHYADPPRPHVRPAVRDTETGLANRIKRALRFR
jgi:Bacteriophage HK97-gp10, putative tail-component